MAFIHDIFSKAKKNMRIIAFPEYDDPRIIEAARLIEKKRIAIPVIVGDPKKISSKDSGLRIIDVTNKDTVSSLLSYYKKIRSSKKKKVTDSELKMIAKDSVPLAILLLHSGLFDAVITGAKHSTGHTLRWGFKIIGLKRGVTKASSYFIMDKHAKNKDDIKLFADCAVQINPTSKELAEIAILTSQTAKKIGLKPKAAMLSFSTKGSANSDETKKIKKAVSLVRKKDSKLIIDGEMQFDSAVDPETAKRKGAYDKIKGKANVFIFPTLDAGNIGYKIMRIYGKYDALGPIIQGLNKPVIDLSRSVSVEEIVDIAGLVGALN